VPPSESKVKDFSQHDDGGYFRNKNGHKYYLKNSYQDDVIYNAPVQHNVSFGYPTQKPEELIEIFIKASSNEGDVVLDAFCGCGTTMAVAKKLNRRYIGIDVSPTACRLVAKRLGDATSTIEGLPASKEEIAAMAPHEFQNWVNREIGSKSGGKGADWGLDGWLEDVPVQVKQYQAGRPDLDKFMSAV
jgi:hypothetical protein